MRNGLLAPILLLSIFAGCRPEQQATVIQPTTEPTTKQASRAAVIPATLPARPVAAVWYEISYPPPGMALLETRRLIVGVWGDGQVIWSEDRFKGGGPYRTARIEPARVTKLLRDLHAGGFFDEKRTVNFGPDASYTVLAADDGSRRQWIGSWHEPAPENPNTVIDERGMHATEPGQPRPQPSPEYAQFLKVWSASRPLIEAVVPERGELVSSLDLNVFKLGRGSK